jgi:arylesterase/paraoxonase
MKKLLWVIPLALITAHFGKLVIDAGAFRSLQNKGFANCVSRGEVVGAEDMEWSAILEKVIVSSDFRPEHGEETASGALYAFSPKDNAPAVKVTNALPFPFHPHGLGIWEQGIKVRVFAVNHRPEEDTVEIFTWEGDHLEHENTLRDPNLFTANDILATGPDSFYVTLDHGSAIHFWQQVEHFTRFGRGSLMHFDGKNFNTVEEHIFFANGLAQDPARGLLYVAEMLAKKIRVYKMEDRGKITYLRSISLASAPDNIKVDEQGDLWAGTHANLFALKKHSENHRAKAPTVIVQIAQPFEEKSKIQDRMIDDGKKLSAASIALHLGGHLYLGSIYDDKVLDCQL